MAANGPHLLHLLSHLLTYTYTLFRITIYCHGQDVLQVYVSLHSYGQLHVHSPLPLLKALMYTCMCMKMSGQILIVVRQFLACTGTFSVLIVEWLRREAAECYSGLYEEGEVRHINDGVWPSFLTNRVLCSKLQY